MANKTFNTRVKNKRDTAANWEAVATTFQPLDGELIIVDTAAGKTRFKVGRYDTAKGRLLYYNEIPFTDEYLYNDLNESQGKIYDTIKGIDDKSIIEMTLEPFAGNDAQVWSYRIGLWQFPKTGFYKINLPKTGAQGKLIQMFARITQDDGTTPEDDWATTNLKRMSFNGGDAAVDSIYALAEYADNSAVTAYRVQFFNFFGFPGTVEVNTYNKTTQKWAHLSVARSDADTANKVGNALTLTKGDTTTTFNGSSAQTVSIPTKTSELTNDSDFTTQNDLDNLTNTVVSYSAQENITDEQKAQARTNIGAISSSDLVQADWNQNDPEAKDYVKNKSLEIPYWEEFGTWTTTYNSFNDNGYLAQNASNVTLCLEVNGVKFENLTYTSGSYGAFTYGDVDTVGVKISNSGMGSSTNSLTVSETMFPDGVTSAHIYRKSLKKLPMDALPDEIDWVKTIDGDSIVTKGNRDYVRSNSYFGAKAIFADNSSPDFNSTVRSAMLYKQSSSYAMPPSVSLNSASGTSTLKLKHPDYTNTYVTADEMPYGSTLVGIDFSDKPVLLNPRRPIATSITSSSTNRQYAGAKAVYDYVKDVVPTIDTDLSSTSENPVQNKVVKAAIDDLQASIDSKSMDKITNGDVTLACGGEDGTEYLHLTSTTDAGCESDFYGNSIYQYLYETDGGSAPALYYYSKSQEKVLGGLSVEQNYTNGKHGIEALSLFTTDGKLNVTSKYNLTLQTTNAGNIIVTSNNKSTNKFDVQIPSTVLAPTEDMNPATKKYVDDQMTTVNNQLSGLTGAMHFIGKAAVDITDGSTTDPQIANYTTKEKGDVILGKDDHKEFVWNGAIWEELGDEGSYALKTTTINGKALSDNITLTASDVGAASTSAIETMQAAIDSKPSAADAVYTATAESTDGVAYTATVSGIDSLTIGASFIMIPNKASTSKAPTLNVNGLGAKPIRRRLSSLTTSLQQGYSTNWIALNKPFTVVYDGTAWVIEGLTKTDGADVYGAVAQATADAKGNNIADTYATIAMLKSLLPKVTTITLTSNWVGDASPYYQDIALSCVTETSIVDLQPTPEQLNSWQDDGLAFTTLSGNGTVRVYVAGGKPSSAISVQVRVQEVTVI